MPTLSIELEEELVDALEAERELLGFESRQAYVRWLVEHRGSIRIASEGRADGRDESSAHRAARLARLEDDSDANASEATGANAGGERSGAEQSDGRRSDRESDAAVAGAESTRKRTRTTTVRATDGSELEVRGSPRRVRQGPDSTIRPDDEPAESNAEPTSDTRASERPGSEPDPNPEPSGNANGAEATNADSGPEPNAGDEQSSSASLTPERVARIPEDSVLEDAGMLGTVETERLDELTRRAVATTRKRLNRDVETGLEYRSSTRLADDSVRPGADIADLGSLSVPGRSDDTIERRRRAVGQALAYLRDERRARRSDFVEALYDEYPAGYGTADGWWRCIKSGLKQVDAVDGGEGARVWVFRE